MGFGERTAKDREVLAVDEHHAAAVDRAIADDDAVTEDLVTLHAEVGAAVLDEGIPFLEAAFIEQELDALARGQFAACVLLVDARLAATEGCCCAFFGRVGQRYLSCALLLTDFCRGLHAPRQPILVPGP